MALMVHGRMERRPVNKTARDSTARKRRAATRRLSIEPSRRCATPPSQRARARQGIALKACKVARGTRQHGGCLKALREVRPRTDDPMRVGRCRQERRATRARSSRGMPSARQIWQFPQFLQFRRPASDLSSVTASGCHHQIHLRFT